MKYMGAAEFKAKCLRVMEEVAATGEEVVVTKRGAPVARVLPPLPEPDEPPRVGWGAGARFRVPGATYDLDGPVVDPDDWTGDLDNLSPDPAPPREG